MDAEAVSLVDELLGHPRTSALLGSFFDPDGPFEGDLLHTLPGNDPYALTLEDLFAVTMLDVRVGPRGVRRLLNDEETRLQASKLLHELPQDEDIWNGGQYLASGGPAENLWRSLIREGDGIGGVTAGKLLARKRPRLIPIVDSVVAAILREPESEQWRAICDLMTNRARRARLLDLRPAGLDERVSTLRLLDVTLWMWGSQARNTKRAREGAGAPRGGWQELHLPDN